MSHSKIHVFACVTKDHQESDELSLACKLFADALPENSPLTWLKSWSELPDSVDTDYVLLVEEPAITPAPDSVQELIRLLEKYPEIDGVMPSAPSDYPVSYFSLYGFERFAETLAAHDPEYRPYDGRAPWMLLIRTSHLQEKRPTVLAAKLGERCVVSARAWVHPFAAYYQSARVECVSLVPTDSQRVLDIGCAYGVFGSALKQQFNCHVTGIEQQSKAAEQARLKLDEVWGGDVFDAKFEKRFDCVTCLDMFEHVADSQGLLEKIRHDFLTPTGHLLLSLPNVGHWSMVEDLLAGRWDYVPAGLLCNTHLRFFTLNSISSLLKENGFQIKTVDALSTPIPEAFHSGLGHFRQQGMQVDEESLAVLQYHLLAQAC
ncbi:MAG: class I SAM-dependent methyltransferase [Pseudomonadota bacterium]